MSILNEEVTKIFEAKDFTPQCSCFPENSILVISLKKLV